MRHALILIERKKKREKNLIIFQKNCNISRKLLHLKMFNFLYSYYILISIRSKKKEKKRYLLEVAN